MKQTDRSEGITIHNYALAFIDLLGQQRQLDGGGLVPDFQDEEHRRSFTGVVRDTVFAVRRLQEDCQSMFDAFQSGSGSLRHLIPPEKHAIYDAVRKTRITTQRWSDGFLAYFDAGDPDILAPMNSLFGLIATCGSMALLGLANGRPIRGGLEMAWGAELTRGELYGCVVAKAYRLESKVAHYPRIVVGPLLHGYLNAHLRSPHVDDVTACNRVIARRCLDLLALDDDGYPIVDYLGSAFRKTILQSHDRELVGQAWSYIVEQSVRWRQEHDTILAMRYAKLRDYFRVRIPDISRRDGRAHARKPRTASHRQLGRKNRSLADGGSG